jgi:Domain of Unknown Function (DUF1080)
MTMTTAALISVLLASAAAPSGERPGFRDTPILPGTNWHVHDSERPDPPVVSPGAAAGQPPSDAVVLLDGTSQTAWKAREAPWMLADGILTAPPYAKGRKPNPIETVEGFGDVQLHLEFRTPMPDGTTGQIPGNSGIWFMQRYEVQILDGFANPTYADGTLGALYGWKPPLVNAARRPGEWQSYDIIFERPRFAADGSLVRPAYATVLLNNVVVQHRQPFLGTTVWRKIATYTPHADSLPLQLQDHGSPVSFRNIWARRLPEAGLSHSPGDPHR